METFVDGHVAIASGETIERTIAETADVTEEVTVYVEAPDGSRASSTQSVVELLNEDVAAEHISIAREELDTAADELLQSIHDDDVDLDEATFHRRLQDANAELEEAAALAVDEQQAIVEELHDYSAFLAMWGHSQVTANGTFGVHLFEGHDEYWNGREQYFQEDVGADDLATAADLFAQSGETYEEAHETFGDARRIAEDAETLIEGISRDVVDEFGNVGYAQSRDEIQENIWVMSEFELFPAALYHGSVGWVHVSDAFFHFEREDLEDATSDFVSAHESFEHAEHEFADFASQELEFVFFFGEALCEIGQGTAAVVHWHDAAQAAQCGDDADAEEVIDAGWELMEECHED